MRKKNKIYNQSIDSIPELREAIKKLWDEKIGESVLEVAGQEHAQEDDVIERAGYLTKY